MKCGQGKCENEAVHQYEWLGERHGICDECVPMLQNVSAALGCRVILEPVSTNEHSESECVVCKSGHCRFHQA